MPKNAEKKPPFIFGTNGENSDEKNNTTGSKFHTPNTLRLGSDYNGTQVSKWIQLVQRILCKSRK